MECQLKGDFVKNLRDWRNEGVVTAVYEDRWVDVWRKDAIGTSFESLSRTDSRDVWRILFETVAYDAIVIDSSKVLISCLNMPIRLYQLNEERQSETILAITDKKHNSETFLSPIQMAVENNLIIGGGKKFLSSYDLTKGVVKLRMKCMDKAYISTVAILNNEVIAGQFDGTISFVDPSTQQISHSFKPHVDAVTRTKIHQDSPMQFFSLARKDNYVYLWDRRNIDSFIQVYENRLYGNQRTGISQLGSVLFLGTENGTIVCKDIATSTAVTVHDFATNKCISSICSIDDKSLICSLGQRSFALQNGKQDNGFVYHLKMII